MYGGVPLKTVRNHVTRAWLSISHQQGYKRVEPTYVGREIKRKFNRDKEIREEMHGICVSTLQRLSSHNPLTRLPQLEGSSFTAHNQRHLTLGITRDQQKTFLRAMRSRDSEYPPPARRRKAPDDAEGIKKETPNKQKKTHANNSCLGGTSTSASSPIMPYMSIACVSSFNSSVPSSCSSSSATKVS